MYKLKNAVKRAQGTDDAGVNWASVSMVLVYVLGELPATLVPTVAAALRHRLLSRWS